MDKPVITSKTAVAHGWGSEPFKWVSHLTADERQAVRDNTAVVLVANCPPCGGGNGLGCKVRRVVYISGRYNHRCACSV